MWNFVEMILEDTLILLVGHFDRFVDEGAIIILMAKRFQEERGILMLIGSCPWTIDVLNIVYVVRNFCFMK